jgi:hypothetical protein
MPESDFPRPSSDGDWSSLPLLSPPRSAWPEIEAELMRRERTRRRRWLMLAAAATLACAALVPRWIGVSVPAADTPAGVATTTSDSDPEAVEMRALMDESAQLEVLVAWSRGQGVESASAASLGAALQERIQRVDLLLARPDADPDVLLPLWQERVLRLRQLAALQNSQHLLAANGDVEPGTPVLAF